MSTTENTEPTASITRADVDQLVKFGRMQSQECDARNLSFSAAYWDGYVAGLREVLRTAICYTAHTTELDRAEHALVGSLVERVAGAVCEAEGCGETPEEWKPEARAAIREVAAWLRESDAKLEMGGDAAATADLLEQEVDR